MAAPAVGKRGEELDYLLVSRRGEIVCARTGENEVLYRHAEAKKVIEWAMRESGITIVDEGSYALTGTVDVPRPDVSLVITEKAELALAPGAKPTKPSVSSMAAMMPAMWVPCPS